ncbi:MAG: LysE family transporter [bacterium]
MSPSASLFGFYGLVVAISLSGVMSPGPLTAITLSRGRRDPFAGFWINVGHSLAETPLILALIGGLGPFLRTPALFRALSLLGGALLLWMGAGLLRKRAGPGENPSPASLKGSPVLAGAAMTALNPYWLLWWLTVGLTLIARARAFEAALVMVSMVALHLACDLAWGTFLSWAVHRGGRTFRPAVWRRIELGCGGALVLFAAYFLWEGITGG